MALRRSPRFLAEAKRLISDENNIKIPEQEIKLPKTKEKTMKRLNKNDTKAVDQVPAQLPSLCRSKERKLRNNYEFVIGLDEAGRGDYLYLSYTNNTIYRSTRRASSCSCMYNP